MINLNHVILDCLYGTLKELNSRLKTANEKEIYAITNGIENIALLIKKEFAEYVKSDSLMISNTKNIEIVDGKLSQIKEDEKSGS